MIIQRNLVYIKWCLHIDLRNDFRYYSKGVTEQDDPDIYIKNFASTCSVDEPRLVFGADVNLGSIEEGNYIKDGEIYLVRHTDKETGNIRYEWRGADLSITPGDYLFVETWAADGFIIKLTKKDVEGYAQAD